MDDIREWLSGNRDYDAGARLYLIHGKDSLLKKVFSEPVSPFKKQKLEESLKALLSGKAETVKKIEATKETAIQRVSVGNRRWSEQMDPTETALHNKWMPIYAEMMNISARLYDIALAGTKDASKKEEAGRMAHKILDLDDECDKIYEQRDYYLKHKKLPTEKGEIELVVDPKMIPLALQNAQRYVRQYKNKLSKKPDDVNAAKKLRQYEWAVAEYLKKLNQDA